MKPVGFDKEIWRDVRGYEGLYQVSNQGRIRCYDRYNKYGKCHHKGHIMRPYMIKGYHTITLRKDGKYKHHQIHRIVAFAFIPNPNNYPCINHKDENRINNNVDNLEWCTAKYNINYGTGLQKRAAAHSVPVNQFGLDGSFICSYPSMHIAYRSTGISPSKICNACKGIRRKAGGYIWKYK